MAPNPLLFWLWRAQYSPIRSRGTPNCLYMMSRVEPDLSGKVIMDRPRSRDLLKVCHPLVWLGARFWHQTHCPAGYGGLNTAPCGLEGHQTAYIRCLERSRTSPTRSSWTVLETVTFARYVTPWRGWVLDFGTKPLLCWLWRAQYSPMRSGGTSISLYMMSRGH